MNCCPYGQRNYTCVLLPLYCTFSLTSSPLPPSQTKCTVYTDIVCQGWGGGGWWIEVYCRPYSAGVLHWFTLTRFRTYKIASPPQTKMISKDDITGLVSIKFLRPWFRESIPRVQICRRLFLLRSERFIPPLFDLLSSCAVYKAKYLDKKINKIKKIKFYFPFYMKYNIIHDKIKMFESSVILVKT